MESVIYFFGSGLAFFVGLLLIGAAIGLACLADYPRLRRWHAVLGIAGVMLVALSAAPLPYVLYGIGGVACLVWLIGEQFARFASARLWLRGSLAMVLAIGFAMEIPYQIAPRVPKSPLKLLLFGDSVSAGMGEGNSVERWPQRLSRLHPIEVHDHSHMGATVRTMLRESEPLSFEPGVVLLEIGGNDLLGSTKVADFERDLALLIERVTGPGRTVVMFELPLPPFANEFGRVQRRLAAQHGVPLIPKRLFVGVLTAEGATVDSVHLSPSGHVRMQELVADAVFRESLPSGL